MISFPSPHRCKLKSRRMPLPPNDTPNAESSPPINHFKNLWGGKWTFDSYFRNKPKGCLTSPWIRLRMLSFVSRRLAKQPRGLSTSDKSLWLLCPFPVLQDVRFRSTEKSLNKRIKQKVGDILRSLQTFSHLIERSSVSLPVTKRESQDRRKFAVSTWQLLVSQPGFAVPNSSQAQMQTLFTVSRAP